MPPEADAAMLKTLHSGYLAEGEQVKAFREQVRAFLGTEQVIPVNSCTMALTIAYDLADVKAGDEVISVPLTSIATNAPLAMRGAKIVWADCEKDTGMIDPAQLEALITPKTKAIVVLHKDGDLAKLDEILAIAARHGVKVIEDAAHAFGAKYKGKMVGTLGDYTCFSFQAIKQITTGDGGVLTTKTPEDFSRGKKLKWLGLDKDEIKPGENAWANDIRVIGHKGNMNDIAATIGNVIMPHAEEILATYNRNGRLYTKLLAGIPGVTLLNRPEGNFETYWVYTALFEDRARVQAALGEAGIASSVVHPRNDAYSIFASSKRSLPGVDYFSTRELSLPCGWWVSEEDITRITDIIRKSI
jgi:dTDP-4-amino-4,6-dideoxygalactose transaminase